MIGVHGLPGYRKGCRCPECASAKSRASKEARERRIRDTAPDKIPHGIRGYYGYSCRCEMCRSEASKSVKERRATPREDTPHGTLNGYTNYACRCDLCSSSYREVKRTRDLKQRYGITQNDFLSMLESQGNGCAICQRTFDEYPGSVDHDHVTARVRGILCRACNSGLGAVHDDPNRILNLIRYLGRTDKLE